MSWPQQLHLALSSGAGRDQACRLILALLLLRARSPSLVSQNPQHCSLTAHVSQHEEDEAGSATPAEAPALIGARASSTHRGHVWRVSCGEERRTVLHEDAIVRVYRRE